LEPGEAVFLSAGNVHAYLSGLGIEVMANSDNVIRGGLTKKNIDIDELLTVAKFTPINVPVQSPVGADHLYHAPVSDFGLRRIELGGSGKDHRELQCAGPELIVVTEGQAVLEEQSGATTTLRRGQVAFVSADEASYRMSGHGLAWRVTVGA
jgi:mannose-6-phosphate isomerase